VREVGIYRAGTCDACGGKLTLVQRHTDREIIGHTQNCKVKNSRTGYVPNEIVNS